jgi:cytidine deaminase
MKSTAALFEEASAVRLNAYAPYTHFLVGSCIETDQGNTYTGCNVENASHSVAVCSEGTAIGKMIAAGEKKIKQILIVVKGPGVSAPCGACRQRLHEFSTPDTLIHLCDLEGKQVSYKMAELLPHAFGPDDLA